MSEWGVALIAASSALAGSLITGWFTRSAGNRQADAARHAGNRQADALLDTVRMTMQEQRAVRLLDLRRQTYVQFLEAAEVAILTRSTGEGHANDHPTLQRAYGAVSLEGPPEVTARAKRLVERLLRCQSLDDLEDARLSFVEAAHGALTFSDEISK
jgi:hypothetical protein